MIKKTKVAEQPKKAGMVNLKNCQNSLNGIIVKRARIIKMANLIRKPKSPKWPKWAKKQKWPK